MRLDVLLIWGHGLPHLDGILDTVRADPNFRIRRVVTRDVDDLPRFVRSVYNFDYAPFRHLIDKTRYLMTTPPRIAVIFADNLAPDECETGQGRFAHLECRKMTALKRAIRERYNPRENGKPSEHHVVHGTDHIGQTRAMIDLLGYASFEALEDAHRHILSIPRHLPASDRWTIKQILMRNVFASINRTPQGEDKSNGPRHLVLPLAQTPHAQMLAGESQAYEDYWQAHQGQALQDDHAPKAFTELAQTLDYLGDRYPDDYLLLRALDEKNYLLLDGLHRAAILRARGQQRFIGAVAA